MLLRVIINKPFCLGLLVASVTWSITIFLYVNILHKIEQTVTSTVGTYPEDVRRNHFQNFEHFTTANYSSIHKISLSTVFRKDIHKESSNFDDIGMIKNLEDKFIRDIGYKQHTFNTLISNHIGIHREIPDTRHKRCLNEKFNTNNLPTTSIIMCFYNEHLMTLLRSVNSVLERSPLNIIKEIILIDDNSDYINLKKELEIELKKFDKHEKVKIFRNTERQGLIRSRVIGAHKSTGDVLIFLDSHIEVNQDWILPLLNKVAEENSTIAVPVIDIINADTFVYTSSPLVRGGFNWGLHFKWENLPEGTLVNETSFIGPFNTPTMAGGLFAISRRYFTYIGEYDLGMDIWGGENLEISFRVWQCGGAVKLLPCSRVGHVFRKRRPYSSPNGSDTMLKNSLRLANVWMDEYKEYFMKQIRNRPNIDYGDIQDRIELRKRLHCKPFSWYLKNIYSEIDIPGQTPSKLNVQNQAVFRPWHSRKRTYIRSFLLRLSNSTLCISVNGKKINGFYKRGSTLSLRPCLRTKNQIWYETDRYEFVLDKLYCLEASTISKNSMPIVAKCHEMLGDQEWRHIKANESPIYNTATGTCLRGSDAIIGANVILDLCSKKTLNSWDIVDFEKQT